MSDANDVGIIRLANKYGKLFVLRYVFSTIYAPTPTLCIKHIYNYTL